MDEQSPIRVMIVDDQQMVRSGLALLIEGFDDIVLAGEAFSGTDAIEVCKQVQPDVVLMDLIMPGVDGITAAKSILSTQPDIRILALTSFVDSKLVQTALQAGMIGYLLKNSSVDELVDAIRKAYQSKPTLAWEATQALVETATNESSETIVLTEREKEVLALMADGLTNRQISQAMSISINTVNAHVRNILSKLVVNSRTEAVSLAVREGLIT